MLRKYNMKNYLSLTQQEFEEIYKEHCEDCWYYGFGDCTECKQLLTEVLKEFNEMEGDNNAE